MALTTIRRKVERLESAFGAYNLPDYPPLSLQEMEALAGCLADGRKWTEEETARVNRNGWTAMGRMVVAAHRARARQGQTQETGLRRSSATPISSDCTG